jgi:hypothetical protein
LADWHTRARMADSNVMLESAIRSYGVLSVPYATSRTLFDYGDAVAPVPLAGASPSVADPDWSDWNAWLTADSTPP